jgi:hypothetical protein
MNINMIKSEISDKASLIKGKPYNLKSLELVRQKEYDP